MANTLAVDQIRYEQIKSVFRTSMPGIVTTLITVTVLIGAMVLIDAASRTKALVVIAVMWVQSAARLYLLHAYSRRPPANDEWRPWALGFTLGTCAGGLTIGLGAIWMVADQPTELQLVALLLVFAVTGGAVGAFSAYLPAFYVFFSVISLPPAIWLFAQGDVFHVLMGTLFFLWFLAVGEQARRTSRQFTDTVRLRLENQDLVADLRREKAFAEQANIAKSRFLAAASHDLRQPVHALSLFVGALRLRDMDGEARALLDHIDTSVRALGGLFGGLLDISRLDAGVVEVNRTSFAIQPLLDRVCRDFESDANRKGLELRSRPTRAVVHSDPLLCERILRNIVANAVAYTDRGTVLVGCRRGPQLRVQVWDTGRGIEPGEQTRIFQEFYQIGNPERDRARGVGLGLAIVDRLKTLLGHTLDLRSWPGRGTCFSLELPYAANAVASEAGTTNATQLSAENGSGLILVVDDEGAIQVAMKSLLQSWGYSVIVAGSGAEMLARIATHPGKPRLIICDYRLRDNETGSAVIERLRSEYNDDIPGMLITGDTAPDRLKEAQASGYLLLHKPVPNSKLRAAITQLTEPTPTP